MMEQLLHPITRQTQPITKIHNMCSKGKGKTFSFFYAERRKSEYVFQFKSK
jgi:hypothetical protein